MNKKLYWIIRQRVLNVTFSVKKGLFHIAVGKDQTDRILPLHFSVLKMAITQVFKGLFITWLITKLDAILLTKLNVDAFDADMFKDIILGGMGIAGVILGLYCANVASIFTAKYTNAPQSLANTFRNDIVTNSCIKQIIGYIVICIIMLLECIIGTQLYWGNILVLLFLTIRMVITFSITGNRTYILSDTFRIADQHYARMGASLKKISNQKFFARDINFQNHFQKLCNKDLSTLLEIAKYNKDIPKNQNPAMCEFMINNLLLVDYYWRIKPSICYNSRWFCDKANYKQWHYASDSEIKIATRTGSPLSIDRERDIWWFEDKILQINQLCLGKILDEYDFETIQGYLIQLTSTSKIASDAGTVTYWVKHLEEIQNAILVATGKIPSEKQKEYEDVVSSVVDTLCCAFMNVIVGINTSFSNLDLEQEYKKARAIRKYSECKFTDNKYLNNRVCERMYRQIGAEYAIEKKRITPDWLVEQTVAYQMYLSLGEVVDVLERIADNIFQLGKQLYEHKKIYSAAVALSHCIEMESKCELAMSRLRSIIPTLEGKHFETSIVWEKVSLDCLEKKLYTVEMEAPSYLVKCCGIFALDHWEKRENSPDFLGFCYNHLCEHLLRAIENDDIKKFDVIYKDFFDVVLLYQEYVRTSVIKHKEEHMQNRVFHVATAPFVEYAIISGLAIIWGEFTENVSWRVVVEGALKRFIDKDPEKHKEILKAITKYVEVRRNGIMGIGNRDVLQTEWEMRISSLIMSSERFDTTYHKYGMETIKTKSKLLSAFASVLFHSHIQLNNSEDIFFVVCVNPYLEDDQKYESQTRWEDKLDETKK